MEEKTYTLREAAELLGGNYEKLKTDVRRGKIPTIDIAYGNRSKKAITQTVLNQLKGGEKEDSYQKCLEIMVYEMRTGLWDGKGRVLTEKWIARLEECLERYWRVLGVKPSVVGVNSQNLKTVMASFQINREKKQDYFTTKTNIYKAIKAVTKILIREGYKPKGFLDEFKEAKPGRTFSLKRNFLDLADVETARLINKSWLNGRSLYDVAVFDILLCLYTYGGLRKMEAANLRMDQVFLDKHYIHVFGKWAIERIVPIVPALREAIESFLIARKKAGLNSIYFVPQADGSMLTATCVETRFRRFKAHCHNIQHMDKLTPHALRRTCATVATINGMPSGLIQKMLGHKHAATTEGYKQVEDRHLIEYAKRFEVRKSQADTTEQEKVQKPTTNVMFI